MDRFTLKKPSFKMILLISAIVLSLIIFFFIFFHKKEGGDGIKVFFSYKPDNATIKIDNQSFSNNSYIYLKPGNHKAYISAIGYQTKEIDLSISELSNMYYGLLIPTDESKIDEYYTENKNFILEKKSEDNRYIENLYPIIAYLPRIGFSSYYDINYELSDDLQTFKVVIEQISDKTPTYTSLQSAIYVLDHIKNVNEDYDITSYDVEIQGFNNKYKNFIDNNKQDPNEFILEGYKNYPNITNIELFDGYYFNDEYYHVSIKEYNLRDLNDYMVLHMVIKKQDDKWVFISQPNPLLTVYNTPNTPSEVLHHANTYKEIPEKTSRSEEEF